jgi:hypothetical protein
LLLIGLGVWTLWAALGPRKALTPESLTLPLEGASKANLRLQHGAGRIHLHAGANATDLLSGTFLGGVEQRVRREGDELRARLRIPEADFPWMNAPHESRDWDLAVNGDIPLALAGAASVDILLPEGVAARIRSVGGLSSTNIDAARFPPQNGLYQSPDYETAPHRADIKIEMGAGLVTVK